MIEEIPILTVIGSIGTLAVSVWIWRLAGVAIYLKFLSVIVAIAIVMWLLGVLIIDLDRALELIGLIPF